ncbi:hypothetical protein D3C85_1510980 [compost metagenome]
MVLFDDALEAGAVERQAVQAGQRLRLGDVRHRDELAEVVLQQRLQAEKQHVRGGAATRGHVGIHAVGAGRILHPVTELVGIAIENGIDGHGSAHTGQETTAYPRRPRLS